MSKTDSSPINSERMASLLKQQNSRFHIHTLAQCPSTNTLLFEQASRGAPSGTVIFTDHQTAGRGSRNRSWHSSPQASLTFSVLWRFAASMEKMAGLSLAVGLAVAKALEDCGACGISLKWPNDILYQNKKLGGILIELMDGSSHELACQTAAICGIGLNLSNFASTRQTDDFPLPVASLNEILSPLPEHPELLSALLCSLAEIFDQFEASGFAGLQSQWQARHAWQDYPVSLLRNGQLYNEGICRGADIDGALLVQTAERLERCLSCDLALKVSLS